MMYKKCLLLKPKETEDELGNITPNGWDIKATCPARFSPWTAEEISLYGSDVTRNTSKYALLIPRELLRGVDLVLIDGVKYSIEMILELSPRWVVIHARSHRDEN